MGHFHAWLWLRPCSQAASATENGGSVYPAGVETVMTGMQPHPGQTAIYEYTCFYAANRFADAKGKSSFPEFKLRVFANAFKITHNWGIRFLGGTIESQIGVPFLYEQLHVGAGKFTKSGVNNVNVIPFSVTYAQGNLHWYYEADLFSSCWQLLRIRASLTSDSTIWQPLRWPGSPTCQTGAKAR